MQAFTILAALAFITTGLAATAAVLRFVHYVHTNRKS